MDVKPSRTLAVLLTLLVAFGPVGTDLYLASLPDMARDLKTDTAHAQLTLGAFVAGFAVMQLGYGPLSDRFGRRRALLGGIILYTAASIMCVFAPSIELLIAGRFVQAMGACCGPVVGRAVVRDIYPPDQAAKVMSYMASAMALAPLVAPTIGGWFHAWFGWRSSFVLLALFGVILLGMVWRLLEETNRHPDKGALSPLRMFANYAALARNRRFLGYTATVTLIFGGVFIYLSSSSFILIETMKVDPRYFGFAFSMASVGFIVGGFAAARLTHRIGIDKMVLCGTIGCSLAGLSLSVVLMAGLTRPGLEGTLWLMVPVMVFFASAASALPNATAGAIAPFPRMAGAASAAIGFTQMTGGAVIGWLAGMAFDGSAWPMALAMTGLGLLATLAMLTLAKPEATP